MRDGGTLIFPTDTVYGIGCAPDIPRAVADVFDALSSDRPYRPRLSMDEAQAWILDGSGVAFDPKVVDAFVCSLQTAVA